MKKIISIGSLVVTFFYMSIMGAFAAGNRPEKGSVPNSGPMGQKPSLNGQAAVKLNQAPSVGSAAGNTSIHKGGAPGGVVSKGMTGPAGAMKANSKEADVSSL